MNALPTMAKTPGDCGARGLQENDQQVRIVGDAGTEIQTFQMLRRRFERLSLHPFPLCDDALLLSSEVGLSRVLPDFHVARQLLRQMEGGAK